MGFINLERFIKNQIIREWSEALLFALVVAFIFRTWLFAPYNVPTGSMTHTIEIGDHVFVNKNSYGFVIPFTDEKFLVKKVNRGDIVVFPYPEDPSIDFIKRVIAVGGDRVRLVGEDVYVNEKPQVGSHIFFDPNLLGMPLESDFTVPEGKLWVMGDNRRNSKDSRYWGYVEESKVTGKGIIIYWSHNANKSLLEGYRFDRIGMFLE